MRRNLAFVALAVAALWLAWAAGSVNLGATVAGAQRGPVGAPGLGNKFAGGWLAEITIGDDPPVEVLIAMGASGSLVGNATTRDNGAFNATTIGSWQPTGPRTCAATGLLFIQDYLQNLLLYEKVNMTLTLSDDGDFMEGIAPILLYRPSQDPLDPAEVPFLEVSSTITLRRIVVE